MRFGCLPPSGRLTDLDALAFIVLIEAVLRENPSEELSQALDDLWEPAVLPRQMTRQERAAEFARMGAL